jgi:hypothetical protein
MRNKMYSINKKLLEEGKIELAKDTLNDLEKTAKLSDSPNVINAMKDIIENYNIIKLINPYVDLKEYDERLKEIIRGSGKKHFFSQDLFN